MLSMSRLQGFLIGLALLYLAWRIVRRLLACRSSVALARFVGAVLLRDASLLAASRRSALASAHARAGGRRSRRAGGRLSQPHQRLSRRSRTP